MKRNNLKNYQATTNSLDRSYKKGPISERIRIAHAERYAPENLIGSDKIQVELVQSQEDLEACYKLVYKQYLSYGYTNIDTHGMRINFWNTLPGTYTLMAKKHGKIIGTVSYVMDSTAGLPMDEVAQASLHKLRHQGKRLVKYQALP
jgi:hypothetical protein